MDYPKRARRMKKGTPEGGRREQREELTLVEYPATRGEDLPWRTPGSDEPDLAGGWREWRPERGRLH